MNRKQFIVLLVFVVVIGGAGLIIHQRNNQAWQSADATIGQKLLPNLAVNDVVQIHLQSGTNVLDLAKQNELWRVAQRADYPADFAKISDLLIKLAGLKVVQTEQIGPSQLGRLELLPPGSVTNAGMLVEFKDQSGQTLNSLLIGKPHLQSPSPGAAPNGMGSEGWPDGRYVMVGTGTKTVDVVSDPLSAVQPQPEQWLNKDFLNIENPCSISVQFPEATNSWQITRAGKTNDWQLSDAGADEKLDSTKLSVLTSPFSMTSFNDVEPVQQGTATNRTTLTVKTFDGFTYVASIAPKQDDNYPVSFVITANLPAERAAAKDEKLADKAKLDQEFKDHQAELKEKLAKEKQFENWVYLLPAYNLDPILKTRGQLLVEQKKAAEPAAIPTEK